MSERARIVVWVQDALGEVLPRVSLIEPLVHQLAETGMDLDYVQEAALFAKMQTGPLDPDIVERVGTTLYALLTAHPAIDSELRGALTVLDPDRVPIYFRLDHRKAEDLPWETLNAPNTGFLATDKRWPIARVKKVTLAKTEYLFQPPLRIMAVLGASGTDDTTRISAKAEWQELFTAVRNSDLNIKMRVLLCEEDLETAINQLQTPWIETDSLVDQRTLYEKISEFKPHILHFFCHGIAEIPPYLQVGSKLDWRRKDRGSINIEASELRQRADKDQEVWLLTLNCCESAQPAGTIGSRSLPLASSLVRSGFPAVIGMRERVDSGAANLFCGLFYETLLGELSKVLIAVQQNGSTEEICWASALFAARGALCNRADETRPVAQVARETKEWTIPVLYTRSQLFRVHLMPDPEGTHPIKRPAVAAAQPFAPAAISLKEKTVLAQEMADLITARDQVAPTLPPKLRKKLEGEINSRLAEIETQLS